MLWQFDGPSLPPKKRWTNSISGKGRSVAHNALSMMTPKLVTGMDTVFGTTYLWQTIAGIS